MQELCVNVNIHDIRKGEYPERDGWYLTRHYTPFDHIGLMPMFWKCDKRAWFICPDDEKEFVPTEHTDNIWTDYFLEGVE